MQPPHHETSEPAVPRKASLWRPIVLAVLVLGALVAARVFDAGERIGELRGAIEQSGAWGPWLFLALYVVAVVAAVPGTALTVAAGALFGSYLGLALASAGSTIGASLSFLIGRYVARDAVAGRFAGNPTFRRLDALTERHGALIVVLTRVIPVFPFNLLNYGFGLTRVPFWTYVFWSWLGMLPLSAVFVVGADAVTAGLARGRIPWGLVLVLGALVLLVVLLARFARRRLQAYRSDDGE